jgi:hypothetical protein
VRFLRVRPGDLTGRDLEGVGIVDSDHVILDHLSISWAPNEGVSSRSARNITLQRSLIAEGLRGGHAQFVERAKPEVVQQNRDRLAELEAKLQKIETTLRELGGG